jgi:hypothetical protein
MRKRNPAPFTPPWGYDRVVLDRLTVDDFRPAVGQTFLLDAGGAGKVDLQLVEARTIEPDAPPTDEAGQRSPFALDFRGPVEPLLPQSIYRLEHESVGEMEIFIVPVGRTEAGTDYEAIFT